MKVKNQEENLSTLDFIIKNSISLFSKKWYSSVSIAEICRKSKISNGLFYHYFQNKEDLILKILDKTVNQIESLLLNVNGNDLNEKIYSLITVLTNFAKENKETVLVFREGQYRYFLYERNLVKIYKEALRKILNKEISLSLYLYVFGGTRFVSIRQSLYGSKISLDALRDIIINGIFNNNDFDLNKVLSTPIKFPDFNYPIKTRDKLIESGMKLFGEKGYNEINIHNITENSNLGTGTFYKYFKSKEIFFEILIELSGKRIRHFISENIPDNFNRLEKELRGIFLFLNYLKFDKNCYNIVREAEFINPKKAKEYYRSFVEGYEKNIELSIDQEKLIKIPYYKETAIEFLLGISHYFGIEFIFDNEKIELDKILYNIGFLLKNGIGEYKK